MRLFSSSIAAFAMVAPISVMAAGQPPVSQAIRQAMEASAAGWNAGNLDRFMAIYADDAVFVTPKGLLRGKTAIAAKYRPSFGEQGNARGSLGFAFLELRGIDPAHAVLFAR